MIYCDDVVSNIMLLSNDEIRELQDAMCVNLESCGSDEPELYECADQALSVISFEELVTGR